MTDADQIVEFLSTGRSDFVRLSVTSRQREVYPSIEVLAEVETRGFKGRAQVWLDEYAAKDFLKALEALDQTRFGRVELGSMDPDDLRISISTMDASGHLLVEYKLGRHVLVGDRPRNIDLQVSGGFELDPSSLPGLVTAFRRLVASRS